MVVYVSVVVDEVSYIPETLCIIALVEQVITTFSLVATGAGVHSRKDELRSSMLESLRPHWYRTIWELGRLGSCDQRATARCEKAIIAWTALGDVLGLKVAAERAAYLEERKRSALLCAWDECIYHTQQPSVSTRLCKGCGEVVSLMPLSPRETL